MAALSVDLGRLNANGDNGSDGRILYLPRQDVIVVLDQRIKGGWWSLVLARRPGSAGPARIVVHDAEAKTGTSTVRFDPDAGPSRAAMVWLSQVQRDEIDGPTATVARALVTVALVADSATIELTPTRLKRIVSTFQVPRRVVAEEIRRLAATGFLRRSSSGRFPADEYALTFPNATVVDPARWPIHDDDEGLASGDLSPLRPPGDGGTGSRPGITTLWAEPEMFEALTTRNVALMYQLLQRFGISQRRIANYTQQCQSEISEILAGRRVESYTVLARIAEGLGIPRGYMGLAYIDPPTQPPDSGGTDAGPSA